MVLTHLQISTTEGSQVGNLVGLFLFNHHQEQQELFHKMVTMKHLLAGLTLSTANNDYDALGYIVT